MTENEAKGWKALAATYAQCVEVAIQQWDGMIGLASAAQQKMAEQMRDRRAVPETLPPLPSPVEVIRDIATSAGYEVDETSFAAAERYCNELIPVRMPQHEIHVPVFTPEDRLQFLKEVSVTLLIEASKRGLSVTKEEDVGPPVVPFGKQKGTPIEAVSGIDLQSMIDWCRDKPDRLVRYADFAMAAEAELTARAAKTAEIQTQPLSETPLALVTEDRP